MTGKHITKQQVILIYQLHEASVSKMKIADTMNISELSVYRVLKLIQAQSSKKQITKIFGENEYLKLKRYIQDLFKVSCYFCIHRKVCKDTLRRMTVIEYNECDEFLHSDIVYNSKA